MHCALGQEPSLSHCAAISSSVCRSRLEMSDTTIALDQPDSMTGFLDRGWRVEGVCLRSSCNDSWSIKQTEDDVSREREQELHFERRDCDIWDLFWRRFEDLKIWGFEDLKIRRFQDFKITRLEFRLRTQVFLIVDRWRKSLRRVDASKNINGVSHKNKCQNNNVIT